MNRLVERAQRRPFLLVGLPFLSAIVAGMFILADIRRVRYERPGGGRCADAKNVRSLQAELDEWEGQRVLSDVRRDYEMKPVTRGKDT